MPIDLLPQIDSATIAATQAAVDPPLGAGGAVVPVRTERNLEKRVQLVAVSNIDQGKVRVVEFVSRRIELGLKLARSGASTYEMERFVADLASDLGGQVLALVFAVACREAMEEDVTKRGLAQNQVRVRSDEAGYATVHSTFGPITFPVFAYRDLSSGVGSVMRHPERALFPYHRICRSTPCSLEWETRLGAQHPFRRAEDLFHFFSREASTVEDTTISRHVLLLSVMVEPSWLYQTPEKIREILATKATRDKTTGRPLLYVSSDAHALRRYVDATWTTQWKMTNGIRIWCEAAATGEIIHLGGEFTWGDCRVVAERFKALSEAGILPNGDALWKQINPQSVFVSDGSEWLIDRLVPLLADAVVILDPYHLIEWFGEFSKVVFGSGTQDARDFHGTLRVILFGKKPKEEPGTVRTRRGRKKRRGQRRPHAHDRRWLRRGRPRTVSSDATTRALLDFLATVVVELEEHITALEKLVTRLADNATRTDYATHLARGMQIGSGPMESMHRSGSQVRLKLPGARWLEETSQAVLTFRMLELSGRWSEFWSQSDITRRIDSALRKGVATYPIPRAA